VCVRVSLYVHMELLHVVLLECLAT